MTGFQSKSTCVYIHMRWSRGGSHVGSSHTCAEDDYSLTLRTPLIEHILKKHLKFLNVLDDVLTCCLHEMVGNKQRAADMRALLEFVVVLHVG